ncbi:MAG: hypothetical protein LUH47_06205 [Clostridiales bacterium]|nr:hypothetical protein [Clostridiales bacterium]
MNTLSTNKEKLEILRNEKAKELGYLCYNMAADGVLLNIEIQPYISAVKSCFEKFKITTGSQKQYYALQLDKEAESLGYVYYNLVYINKKATSGSLETLCRNIADISDEIAGRKTAVAVSNGTAVSGGNKSIYLGDTSFLEKVKRRETRESFVSDFEDSFTDEFETDFNENTENNMNGFKVNCPYGMEPIPVNAKKCRCGYRNRSYAKYCGKCGAKL